MYYSFWLLVLWNKSPFATRNLFYWWGVITMQIVIIKIILCRINITDKNSVYWLDYIVVLVVWLVFSQQQSMRKDQQQVLANIDQVFVTLSALLLQLVIRSEDKNTQKDESGSVDVIWFCHSNFLWSICWIWSTTEI